MAVTDVHWPSGLPSVPVVANGSYIRRGMPDNLTVNDKPDAGPVLSRPRASAFYRPYTIPLIVKTFEEVDIFEDFYVNTLSVGTRPFLWEGWVRNGPSVFRFDLTEDPPNPEPLGEGVHRITLNLLQYPEGAV